MTDRTVEYLPVRSLKERFHPDNPKEHDLGLLHLAIERFGFTAPVIVCERTGYLAAGHGRLTALHQREQQKALVPDGIRTGDDGEWLVPVVRGWESADDVELKAYLIADNKVTEAGGWDDDTLLELLGEINDGVGLQGTGFDSDDIDQMLKANSWNDKWRDRPVKENDSDAGDVQAGDVWRVGDALIACGDSTDPDTWSALLGDEKADLLLTDPPYGIAYTGGAGAARQMIDNDELSPAEMQELIEKALGHAVSNMRPGAVSYVFGPTGRELLPVLSALDAVGLFRWTLVWAKDRLIPSRADFNMQHETIIHGKPGDNSPPSAHEFMVYGWTKGAGHRRPFDPESSLSTLWTAAKPSNSKHHPTEKPVELLGRAIDISTAIGDLVIDPFNGSGSTLVAAVSRGRSAAGIELLPEYVGVTLDRLEEATGATRELIARDDTPRNPVAELLEGDDE